MLLLTGVILLIGKFYTHDVSLGLLFNPDIVYIHLVIQDLFANPMNLGSWTLPSVTFLLPDFPLFSLAALFTSEIYLQYTVFAVLQLATLTVLTYHLLRLRYVQAMAAFFASASFLLVVSMLNGGLFAIDTAITPLIHFGSVIFYLLIGLLVLRYLLGRGQARTQLLMIGAASFMSVFSDKLIIIQLQGPLLVFLLYYASRRESFKPFPLMATIAGSCMAGLLALKLLLPGAPQASTSFGLANLGENLRLLSLAVVEIGQNTMIASAVIVFVLVCAGLMLTGPRWLARLHRGWESLQPLAIFLALSVVLNLLVVLASNQVFTPRYALPLYFLPLLALVVLAYEALLLCGLRPAHMPLLGMCAAGILLFNMASALWEAPAGRYAFEHYPPSIACIDRVIKAEHMQRGMAGYMDAKTIQTLSKENIIVAQYKTPFLAKDEWETNLHYFAPHYDFAIVDKNYRNGDRVDIDTIKKINGDDIQMVDCDPLRIYYYASRNIHTRP